MNHPLDRFPDEMDYDIYEGPADRADAERKRLAEETRGTVHVVVLVYPKAGIQVRCFASKVDMNSFVARIRGNPRCPATLYEVLPNQDIE